MKKAQQPATKSYFFSKGYVDLKNTIHDAWYSNLTTIRNYWNNLGLQDLSLEGVFLWIVNFVAILAVGIFGSIITALVSLVNVTVLFVCMTVIYIGFGTVWVIDRLYLTHKRIFSACPECKEKSLIPIYICPQCGAKHTNLTPGVYGILHRKCNCGAKLPTNFMNGRNKLQAECPFCGRQLSGRESRPICIPIVGGRSVGKTAFITAFSKEFIDKVAPDKGFNIEFYDKQKEDIFKEINIDYSRGSTRMTNRPQDVNATSSVSFSFFIEKKGLVPDRLVHIYDIAGEVFTDNNENEMQKQYEYCQGIVMILDPFSIPSVKLQYEDFLSPEDRAGIGKSDINIIIDSFLNKLREVTGLSDKKISSVPLAVLINKIDSAGLDSKIGINAVKQYMNQNSEKNLNFFDVEDYLCRNFLKENNMEGFLSNIVLRFKTNRFFSCSAIGHPRDAGEYNPVGVLPPMEWIFRLADSRLGKLWHDNDFTSGHFIIKEGSLK